MKKADVYYACLMADALGAKLPVPEVVRLLGVSSQRVHQMFSVGKLERYTDVRGRRAADPLQVLDHYIKWREPRGLFVKEES